MRSRICDLASRFTRTQLSLRRDFPLLSPSFPLLFPSFLPPSCPSAHPPFPSPPSSLSLSTAIASAAAAADEGTGPLQAGLSFLPGGALSLVPIACYCYARPCHLSPHSLLLVRSAGSDAPPRHEAREALQHLSHLLPDPATLLLSTNLLFHANTHPSPTFFLYLSLAPLPALHHRHALQHLARVLPDPAALPLSTGLLFHLLSQACLCAMPRSSLLFLFQPAAHRLTRDVGLVHHLLPPLPIPHVHVSACCPSASHAVTYHSSRRSSLLFLYRPASLP
ncbi:unnamed protein product [Closterium sp. NIES-64]|nr:unnamed protein product [Closterium sp. NIES-64]